MQQIFSDRRNTLLAFILAIYAFIVLRTAWVMEDAYITLRTVDNWVNGYGLTWNTYERVQAYTHPLWMLLLAAAYAITHEAFYTTIALSILVSVFAFVFVIGSAPRSRQLATIAALSILIFSRAFIDYSTSGLENPATHLLVAAFLFFLFAERGDTADQRLLVLSFIAGLAVLNRMDTILLFVPALLLVWLQALPASDKSRAIMKRMRLIILGFAPFLLWEAFSLLYYGFPFPNTAYAKLVVPGLTRADLMEQGYLYFLDSLHLDPVTLFAIALGIGTSLLAGDKQEKAAAVGGILYLLYIVYIGGDNMSGRFFSAVLILSVILLIRRWAGMRFTEGVVVLAFILILGLLSPVPTTSMEESTLPITRLDTGATDVRRWLFPSAALLYDKRNTVEPYYDWVYQGLEMRKLQAEAKQDTFVLGGVGYAGYFAGPHVRIIDQYGLTDALLARLPPQIDPLTWRPAHFVRPLPDGYLASVKTGENKIADPSLHEYYSKLLIITRGHMLSWDRLVTIIRMNTGQYDYLLADYVHRSAGP